MAQRGPYARAKEALLKINEGAQERNPMLLYSKSRKLLIDKSMIARHSSKSVMHSIRCASRLVSFSRDHSAGSEQLLPFSP